MVFVNRYYLSKEEFSYKNIFHEDFNNKSSKSHNEKRFLLENIALII